MPARSPDKLVVTHKAALKRKYGAAGLKRVLDAVAGLTAADKARGIVTAVIDLSSAADATKHKFAAVPLAKVADAKLHKTAIDKAYKANDRPAYVLLLGAVDVIPQVPLKNPLHVRDAQGRIEDPDEVVPSDLPYACDAGYGTDPRAFLAPDRVVGRLPDVTGAGDPAYLVGLLETAANYTQRPRAKYDPYFGLSAAVWKGSTAESLDRLFGSNTDLQLSPKVGTPGVAAKHLDRLAHFINCHGAAGVPRFMGQDRFGYPTALDAGQLAGAVKEGTVVAAECCYGAELYDPAVTLEAMGICNTYLREKAYGYFGSSTIAYGPADGNEMADLICRYFLDHVRAGGSLGRAALLARLDYVRSLHGTVTATDLKTLAQFALLGDPSLAPVPEATAADAVVPLGGAKSAARGVAGDAAAAAARFALERFTRDGRRAWLRRYSDVLVMAASVVTDSIADAAVAALTKGTRSPVKADATDKSVGAALRGLADEMGLSDPAVMTFGLSGTGGKGAAGGTRSAGRKGLTGASPPAGNRVHVVIQRTDERVAGKPVVIRGFEAVEFDGLLRTRKFQSR